MDGRYRLATGWYTLAARHAIPSCESMPSVWTVGIDSQLARYTLAARYARHRLAARYGCNLLPR
jgi:hypothetical protein